jgi:pantoate--beta-alanine ligase
MTTIVQPPSPAPAASAGPFAGGARVQVYDTIAGYSGALDAFRRSGMTVGVVPTMGALHEGHRSLIRRAAEECDVVAVSIFVNPTQFGDPADLASYPRTWGSDLESVAAAGGQVVFAPTVDEMYPDPEGVDATTASVPALSARWEGASRPGHFDGVATVVVKLLKAAGRCRAYFGEKDFQQLAVVRRVVKDRSLPAEVIGCQTVRDRDGLALSSRNARLSPEQRRAALALSRALQTGAALVAAGEVRSGAVVAAMEQVVATEPLVELDYAAVVGADDLEPTDLRSGRRACRLLIAATVGPVRLIDNLDPDPARSLPPGGRAADPVELTGA